MSIRSLFLGATSLSAVVSVALLSVPLAQAQEVERGHQPRGDEMILPQDHSDFRVAPQVEHSTEREEPRATRPLPDEQHENARQREQEAASHTAAGERAGQGVAEHHEISSATGEKPPVHSVPGQGEGKATPPATQRGHEPERRGDRVVIRDINRTVINENFGPFWPTGPRVLFEDAAIADIFGWQPAETVITTVPLEDFGQCRYHRVTDRLTGAEKAGVWIDGIEVVAGTDNAIEQVLTNCTMRETPAATFAEVITGFAPALAGYEIIDSGPGIASPVILHESNVERLTYYVRNKSDLTRKVVADWGPHQKFVVTSDKM